MSIGARRPQAVGFATARGTIDSVRKIATRRCARRTVSPGDFAHPTRLWRSKTTQSTRFQSCVGLFAPQIRQQSVQPWLPWKPTPQ